MGRIAALLLAKSAGNGGLEGCPDLRRFADHSGGTVADSHGLPRFPNLFNVERQSKARNERCQPMALERGLFTLSESMSFFPQPVKHVPLGSPACFTGACKACGLILAFGALIAFF